jgi:hypothetical protein
VYACEPTAAQTANVITPLEARMFCSIPNETLYFRRRCLAFKQFLAGGRAKQGVGAQAKLVRALSNIRNQEAGAELKYFRQRIRLWGRWRR